MIQNTVQRTAAKRLTKKRCTNSSCRRIFSVDDSEYNPGRCPYCGKVYPRANEKYQIKQKKWAEVFRRQAASDAESVSAQAQKESSRPQHLVWLLNTGRTPNAVTNSLKRSLHITRSEACTLADRAPLLLGRFADRKKAHKIGGCLSRAGAAVWTGTSEDAPDVLFEEMDLSVRAFHCLKRAGFNELKDIVGMGADELFLVRNLGGKCPREVEREIGNQLLIHARRRDRLHHSAGRRFRF